MREFEKLHYIKSYIKSTFDSDATGHDFEHMQRVASWSKQLADSEGADSFLCEVTGWLHDIGDLKLFDHPKKAIQDRDHLLEELGFTQEEVLQIDEAISTVSFSKGGKPQTHLGAIVQDADRLDALGAVGIARTFAYGGARGQKLYSESENITNSVQHFYDKLLHLSSLMNTESGMEEAQRRHRFMEKFLKEFKREQSYPE